MEQGGSGTRRDMGGPVWIDSFTVKGDGLCESNPTCTEGTPGTRCTLQWFWTYLYDSKTKRE